MKKIIFALVLLSAVAEANAQNGVNSPYSRYGFGIMSERAMGFNKGMGGVAQGFRDGKEVNVANPASYSEVDSLTALFDLGISLQNGNYKMGGLQQNIKNSSFDYFAFQFRAAHNVGMALGIMPVTNIKYSFASAGEPVQNHDGMTSSYSFSGDGGLREVFLGAGWKPFAPLSVGVNASYLWGDYAHNMAMTFSESSAFSMARVYSADISTYNVQGGLQYIQPLSKKDKIVLGATYTLGHKVNNNAYRDTRTTLSSGSIEAQTIDTIRNAFQLPHSVAAGVTYYHSDRLRVGADFELQKWSDCQFPNQQTGYGGTSADAYQASAGQLYDRTKIAAGLDWTPNPMARGLLKKSTYKVGGYFSNSYAKADPTGTVTDKPYEFGVSAGMTLPIANRNIWYNSPKINVSVQWVHTSIPYLNASTLRQSSLTENYFKLCLGITFNERWFYKWKVQ